MSHDAIMAGPAALDRLFTQLKERGYRIIGPTALDGAIVLEELESASELPVGWTERQEAGSYRLEKRGDEARFGFTLGPQSFKRYLFPPHRQLWSATRVGASFEFDREGDQEPSKYAFIGIRPCEIAAINIQDKIFNGESHADPYYASVRERAFFVAVNCAEAGGTCFCTSMGTGPRATADFDLAVTEMNGGVSPEILFEAGSANGQEMVALLGGRQATDEDIARSLAISEKTAASMEKKVEVEGLRDRLMDNLEHPRFQETAKRCLACGNCTMVCPTCFCNHVEDVPDLSGDHSARWRRWDSCFTGDHAYVHGGNMRPTIRSRYRQWLTHKFASWKDQYDTYGCVGCGRCVTWCPAAIDVTEEIAAIR